MGADIFIAESWVKGDYSHRYVNWLRIWKSTSLSGIWKRFTSSTTRNQGYVSCLSAKLTFLFIFRHKVTYEMRDFLKHNSLYTQLSVELLQLASYMYINRKMIVCRLQISWKKSVLEGYRTLLTIKVLDLWNGVDHFRNWTISISTWGEYSNIAVDQVGLVPDQ